MTKAGILVIAAVVTVSAAAWGTYSFIGREGELPPVHEPCITDIFADLDLASIEIGKPYRGQTRATFGKAFLDDTIGPRCIAFAYDEDLLSHPPLFLTVLVQDGVVKDRWLEKAAFSQAGCRGLPRDVVGLQGYFHARACLPGQWE